MEGLMILLLFPIAWPFIAKRIWHTTITWQEMTLQIVIVVLVTTVTWQLGKYGATHDTEIWNGQVTSKDRDHGHYLESYACNCTETCSGSGSNRSCTETCDTCYEDHYTVTWTANTTVGNVQFDHLDSTWQSVYDEPDPVAYKKCTIGEPASIEHGYTNYVQAVPESLFHDDSELAEQYQGKIPVYPSVYSFYKINRVLDIGVGLDPSLSRELNDRLNKILITLGNAKEVNIVLIVTNIKDPSYRYAVENAWLGGEKNDVIIFLGMDNSEIAWTDVITWALNSGNEVFHVKMRDGLKSIGNLNPDLIVPFIEKTISRYFDRPQMADFEYLEDAIEPPTWVIILAIFFAIGGSLALTLVFHKNEVELFSGIRGTRSFRRFR